MSVRELSLFTGAGGGIWGTKLLGWKTIGYVEKDDYCQRVIRQRIKDGIFDDAPIFPDVRTFNGLPYRGKVDILTAGFPCQPFSLAGRRKGENDDRNMWPDTIRVIREVGPRFCLLENVPGLVVSGYFPTILKDLSEAGYNAKWDVISAAEVGAPHNRNRVWIMAHTNRERLEGIHKKRGGEHLQSTAPAISRHKWEASPRVHRTGDGLAYRVDRLKALGNGQVPAVVREAWNRLTGAA